MPAAVRVLEPGPQLLQPVRRAGPARATALRRPPNRSSRGRMIARRSEPRRAGRKPATPPRAGGSARARSAGSTVRDRTGIRRRGASHGDRRTGDRGHRAGVRASCGRTARRTSCSRRCAAKCPVHWSGKIDQYPDEAGFWSVTTAEDVHTVSRDWETYSSELGGVTVFAEIFPLELVRAMFIGQDPPKHDRVKALFQRGFTPKRIADHEERIRAITCEVLDRLEGQRALRSGLRSGPAGRLAGDLELHGPLRGGRRDVGADHERGAGPRRPRAGARGHRRRAREGLPGNVRALPRADRRAPREPHRRPHERARPRRSRRRETRGDRDRDGLLPADGGRERLDQGDLLQRHAGADGRPGAAARAGRGPLAGPGGGRGGAADVPRLRALPPHGHAATPSCTASRSRRARRW